MIEKANAPDDIDGEVFWFSEVNRGLSFQLANGERDFVAVGIERTCCRAKVQENFARVSYRRKCWSIIAAVIAGKSMADRTPLRN